MKNMKNLKTFEIKGNEIDKKLYKEYSQILSKGIENFEAYSEDELECQDEDTDEITKDLEKLKIKK